MPFHVKRFSLTITCFGFKNLAEIQDHVKQKLHSDGDVGVKSGWGWVRAPHCVVGFESVQCPYVVKDVPRWVSHVATTK